MFAWQDNYASAGQPTASKIEEQLIRSCVPLHMELQANARHSDARASCAYPKYVEIRERIEIRTYLL